MPARDRAELDRAVAEALRDLPQCRVFERAPAELVFDDRRLIGLLHFPQDLAWAMSCRAISAIAAFLEVGRERNKLVHQDYASFPFEKTLDEIYDLYRRALGFVENLHNTLRDQDHHANASSRLENQVETLMGSSPTPAK